jgi:hypothetical protein
MIEFNDPVGRLIVVLRVARKNYCVYVEGKWAASFLSGREALDCGKSLAKGQSDSSDPSPKGDNSSAD